ncbi:MAG: ABC transporter permease [Candidatus Dojkabacteria bacterium]
MDQNKTKKLNIAAGFVEFIKTIKRVFLFLAILSLFFVRSIINALRNFKLTKFIFKSKPFEILNNLFLKFINLLDPENSKNISKIYLIELAWHNLQVKRTRTFVTIGGIAIGMGLIVFLVSIGYGVQKVVINQVAKLEELRQAEVYPGLTKDLELNDAALAKFKEVAHVEKALPLITVVGRLNYKNSVSDMAVYGVTREYLENSAIKPSTGKIFKSNSIVNENKAEATVVETDPIKESTELSTVTQAKGTLPFVELDGESDQKDNISTKKVDIVKAPEAQLVINTAALKVLDLTEEEAIGKEVSFVFVATSELTDLSKEKVESTPTTYTISGVIPDDSTPYVYVPLVDIRSLGINKYTQVKVIVDVQENLAVVRKSIESSGYGTTSVVDTVDQIDRLFATVQLILSLVGTIALSVATLGMFNTLTVSLLERTREVGLMKAMGMKSEEVKELFLTESMIMGFLGGVMGLLFGFLAGKLLSILASSLFIVQGGEFIDITYIPYIFTITIVLLSVAIGVFTGIYPAKRATKISALNALRYE